MSRPQPIEPVARELIVSTIRAAADEMVPRAADSGWLHHVAQKVAEGLPVEIPSWIVLDIAVAALKRTPPRILPPLERSEHAA